MQRRYFTLSILHLAILLVSCTTLLSHETKTLEDHRMPTDVPAPVELTQAVEAEIASKIPPKDCPVTTVSEPAFAAPEPYSPSAPWEGIFWFGSEHLWTALHNDGVWSGLPKTSDGYTQKIMWWSDLYSLPDEPEPALVVTGHRLDGESPDLRFYDATHAMANDIGEAMLTGVEFPTLGCWEVTGQYKKTGLTFVVWITP
ncbi:MAG: hypothetical protein QY306_14200 [Anaerolineales bacterium]|nr:MAG: hypothetical protein QY306_14200 [Anaerolineales bacterium]